MVFAVQNSAKSKKSESSPNSSGGFSLIEVAIALIIIGVLIGPMMYTYGVYIKKRQINQTASALSIVNQSLIRYVAKYGHYPYPADRNIAIGTAGFGQAATEPGGGWPACPVLPAISGVTCETNVNAFGGGSVLIGDVPFATLGVPYKSVLDGYGMKMTYAVTKALAQPIPFNESAGAIEVLNATGASIYAAGEARSHYMVVSHGKDQRGGFNLGGTLTAACGSAADSTDFENCNSDARFRNNFDNVNVNKNLINDAAGVTHFDDWSVTTNVAGTGIWAFIPSQPSIRTDVGGNLFIGPVNDCATFTTCLPLARIDVAGDVRADKIKSDRLCRNITGNATDRECVNSTTATFQPQWFSPDQVADATPVVVASTTSPAGNEWQVRPPTALYPIPALDPDSQNGHKGAGIRCVEDMGMRGIKNFDEMCSHTAYFDASVNIGSCGAGTYPTQLDAAGQLSNCIPP
jgi:prepilin-type N-terminal cleavage/methylation domain-containing protein